MKTELNVVDPGIINDRKIDVTLNNIRNARIFSCVEKMSYVALFILKCDSNNSAVTVKPSDSAKINAYWRAVESEMAFHTADENQDLPGAALEKAKIISEIRRMNNPKLQAVVDAIYDCVDHCLSTDSAKNQGFTSPADQETMGKWLAFVDRVIERQVGRGSSMTDTGEVLPFFPEMGRIEPSLDQDWSQLLEHNADQPRDRYSNSKPE